MWHVKGGGAASCGLPAVAPLDGKEDKEDRTNTPDPHQIPQLDISLATNMVKSPIELCEKTVNIHLIFGIACRKAITSVLSSAYFHFLSNRVEAHVTKTRV
jgi:hypothetical protein